VRPTPRLGAPPRNRVARYGLAGPYTEMAHVRWPTSARACPRSATQTEPPQNSLPAAQIQWHRTTQCASRVAIDADSGSSVIEDSFLPSSRPRPAFPDTQLSSVRGYLDGVASATQVRAHPAMLTALRTEQSSSARAVTRSDAEPRKPGMLTPVN